MNKARSYLPTILLILLILICATDAFAASDKAVFSDAEGVAQSFLDFFQGTFARTVLALIGIAMAVGAWLGKVSKLMAVGVVIVAFLIGNMQGIIDVAMAGAK